MFKKIISIILVILFCVTLVSCKNSSNVYDNKDYASLNEDGRINVVARLAYYNNGKTIEQLKDVDSEKAKETPVNDGSFCVYFAITNLTEYDRKITELKVKSIQNSKNYEIISESEFTMDDDFYLASGQTEIVECLFEKDFVKMNVTLDELITVCTVKYEGCVVNGEEPNGKEGVAFSVKEAKFTLSNGLQGSFYIKNFENTPKKIDTIRFMLYTDKGIKITKKPVEMPIDATLEPNESYAYNYGITQDNINEDIKENKLFDNIIMKVED